MDRIELRFRILFEYYEELHLEYDSKNSASGRVDNMDIPDTEKRAAKIWLIDSNYVNGSNPNYTSSPIPHPFIGRINNCGIDFVESAMDSAFTKTKYGDENIAKLSKLDRIKKFGKYCLKKPTTSKMCEITLNAIIEYMKSHQP